jgi:hypothetical protein
VLEHPNFRGKRLFYVTVGKNDLGIWKKFHENSAPILSNPKDASDSLSKKVPESRIWCSL